MQAMDRSYLFRDAPIVLADWAETSDSHVFRVSVPGLKKDEIRVEVQEENVLQISGEFKKPEDKSPIKYHVLERAEGRFVRQFQLPYNVRVENCKAHEENGVLTVIIPKRDPQKAASKRVPITSKL